MKADILLHIPMQCGADWYMNSQKLQHNCGDVSFSDITQARIQGGQGGLAPPPIFWGKNKGAKNHTHRKKEDQNRTTTKQDTG